MYRRLSFEAAIFALEMLRSSRFRARARAQSKTMLELESGRSSTSTILLTTSSNS